MAYRKPVAGYTLIFATVLGNLYFLGKYLFDSPANLTLLFKWEPHSFTVLMNRLTITYITMASRVSTYYIGVTLGHLLYLYNQGKIVEFPKIVRCFGAPVALLTLAIIFWGPRLVTLSIRAGYFNLQDNQLGQIIIVGAIILFKMLVEISVFVLLLLLTTGSLPDLITRMLDNKFMKVCSNLSYGVFLNHIEIITKPAYYQFESHWEQIYIISLGFIVSSYLISLLTHLFIELPINNLTRLISKRVDK